MNSVSKRRVASAIFRSEIGHLKPVKKEWLPLEEPDKMATTTDFSKFRESGELSDLTVSVNGNEFKLHKFPLFIKSDFFRALARTNVVDKDRVELEDFPGGVTTFEQVANYCYNIRIEVNEKNVCKLRCAAEFLQMNTPGNLADATDRLLQDIISTAKLDKNVSIVADLLVPQCKELGAISEQAKVIDKCIGGIVDCWLFKTQFHKNQLNDLCHEEEAEQKLFELPLAWFVLLFTTAKDKGVDPPVIADIFQKYITHAINEKAEGKSQGKVVESSIEQARAQVKEEKAGNDADGTCVDQQDEEDEQKEDEQHSYNGELQIRELNDDEDDTSKDTESSTTKQTKDVTALQILTDEPVKDLEVAVILDTLFGEFPEEVCYSNHLIPAWALRVLKVAEANECKCADKLRKIVSRVVHRLPSEELAQLSPDHLADIVRESCKDDQESQKEMACILVDSYLFEIAKRDLITVDIFNKMVEAVPSEFRFRHDTLFQVMEALLNSANPGKKKVKLTDEQKEAVLETIDFSRLTENTLERAYQTALVPANHIAKAALSLCSKLRRELEDAQAIIKSRETKSYQSSTLDKYSNSTLCSGLSMGDTSKHSSGSKSSGTPTKHSIRDLDIFKSPSSRIYEPLPSSIFRSYSTPRVPSFASERELRMALDNLERTPERRPSRDPLFTPFSDIADHTSSNYRSLPQYNPYEAREPSVEGDFSYPRHRSSYRPYSDPWPYRY